MGIYKDIAQTMRDSVLETEIETRNSNLIFDFCPIILRQLISPRTVLSYTVLYSHSHTIRSTRFVVMFSFFINYFIYFFLLLFFFVFVFFFDFRMSFCFLFSVFFWWLPLNLNKRMFIIYIYIYSTINMANYNTLFIAYAYIHTMCRL